MANTTITTAARNAAVDAVVDLLDGGAGAAKIFIYDNSAAQPTTAQDAVPGGSVLLATLTCSDPAFGSGATGVATAASITGATAAETGTAAWFRATTSADTAVIDGDITATGGGGDMTLNTVSITSGASVDVTSWTVTMPSGE